MTNHLRLTGVTFAPFIFLKDNDKNYCDGINCNLIKYLSRSLNFTFEFIKYSHFAFLPKNGNWSGPFEIIQRGVRSIAPTMDHFVLRF